MEENQNTEAVAPEVSSQPAAAPQTEEVATAAPESEANQADTVSPTEELYQSSEEEAEPQPEEAGPIEYDFEGVTAEVGDITNDDIASVKALSEELKLTKEQARELLSKSGKYMLQNMKARQSVVVNEWFNEVKSDPQLGGANFKNTQANLRRAMKRYGNGDALKVLSDSGIGAHPAIVKMLNAIGKDLGEETKFVNSKSQAPKPKSKLRSLYDNSPNLDFGD